MDVAHDVFGPHFVDESRASSRHPGAPCAGRSGTRRTDRLPAARRFRARAAFVSRPHPLSQAGWCTDAPRRLQQCACPTRGGQVSTRRRGTPGRIGATTSATASSLNDADQRRSCRSAEQWARPIISVQLANHLATCCNFLKGDSSGWTRAESRRANASRVMPEDSVRSDGGARSRRAGIAPHDGYRN